MGIYNKEYHWVCPTCNIEFKSRRKLQQHYKDNPNHKIKKSHANKQGEFYCKYCGYKTTTLSGLHVHEKYCKYNDNREIPKNTGIKMSPEFKNNLSKILKERHKNGTTKPISQLRKNKEHSYPEQWLINVIHNENLDKNYICEFPFYTFYLDFCWPDKKLVIEMDGNFHKTNPYQIDCDKRKDELLLKDGYKELRIDWQYCFNHPKEIIEQIKHFLQ